MATDPTPPDEPTEPEPEPDLAASADGPTDASTDAAPPTTGPKAKATARAKAGAKVSTAATARAAKARAAKARAAKVRATATAKATARRATPLTATRPTPDVDPDDAAAIDGEPAVADGPGNEVPDDRPTVERHHERHVEGRLVVPAGRAYLTMLVAFAVAALLGADSLDRVAERQPYGTTRDVARAVTGPLQSVSHALLLDRPREWLADLTNHQDPPTSDVFGPSGTTDPTAGPIEGPPTSDGTTPTTPPPAPTTTTLPVRRVPTAEAPLRVLFAGDSLVGNLSEGYFRHIAADPRITLSTDVQVSTGLVRTDILNWADQLQADIVNHQPDVVYLMFGANDDQPLHSPAGDFLRLGTEEWTAEYQRRVGVMMDIASQGGIRSVVWIGLPAVRPEQLDWVKDVTNEAGQVQAATRLDVQFVDTRPVFNAPDGTYSDTYTYPDGGVGVVRSRDGVHFTQEGADLLAPTLFGAIVDRWHLR